MAETESQEETIEELIARCRELSKEINRLTAVIAELEKPSRFRAYDDERFHIT